MVNNNDPDFFWDRRKRKQKEPAAHYSEEKSFGHNKKQFLFPPFRDREMAEKFEAQRNNNLEIPNTLIPDYDISETCEHGSTFDPSDANLVLLRNKITIYKELSEEEFDCQVYGRRSAGN